MSLILWEGRGVNSSLSFAAVARANLTHARAIRHYTLRFFSTTSMPHGSGEARNFAERPGTRTTVPGLRGL